MTWAALLAAGGKALAWLSKPPGLYVVLLIAALTAILAYGGHEYRAGKAYCEAAHKIAAAVEIQRQANAGAAVVRRAETKASAGAVKDKKNQESIRYVVKTIAVRSDAQLECIPAAIADSLRSLD